MSQTKGNNFTFSIRFPCLCDLSVLLILCFASAQRLSFFLRLDLVLILEYLEEFGVLLLGGFV
jgi:hypothetical protein